MNVKLESKQVCYKSKAIQRKGITGSRSYLKDMIGVLKK